MRVSSQRERTRARPAAAAPAAREAAYRFQAVVLIVVAREVVVVVVILVLRCAGGWGQAHARVYDSPRPAHPHLAPASGAAGGHRRGSDQGRGKDATRQRAHLVVVVVVAILLIVILFEVDLVAAPVKVVQHLERRNHLEDRLAIAGERRDLAVLEVELLEVWEGAEDMQVVEGLDPVAR
jgi:hypothetical protein